MFHTLFNDTEGWEGVESTTAWRPPKEHRTRLAAVFAGVQKPPALQPVHHTVCEDDNRLDGEGWVCKWYLLEQRGLFHWTAHDYLRQIQYRGGIVPTAPPLKEAGHVKKHFLK
jgi:hypothetical protein